MIKTLTIACIITFTSVSMLPYDIVSAAGRHTLTQENSHLAPPLSAENLSEMSSQGEVASQDATKYIQAIKDAPYSFSSVQKLTVIAGAGLKRKSLNLHERGVVLAALVRLTDFAEAKGLSQDKPENPYITRSARNALCNLAVLGYIGTESLMVRFLKSGDDNEQCLRVLGFLIEWHSDMVVKAEASLLYKKIKGRQALNRPDPDGDTFTLRKAVIQLFSGRVSVVITALSIIVLGLLAEYPGYISLFGAFVYIGIGDILFFPLLILSGMLVAGSIMLPFTPLVKTPYDVERLFEMPVERLALFALLWTASAITGKPLWGIYLIPVILLLAFSLKQSHIDRLNGLESARVRFQEIQEYIIQCAA